MQKDSDELVGMTCILSFVKNRLTSFKFVILGHINTHVDIWGIDKYSYIHTHKYTNVHSYIHVRIHTYINTHFDIWGTYKYSYIHTYKYTNVHSYVHVRIHTYINTEKSVTTQTYCLFFSAAQILDFRFQKQVSFLF